MTDTASNGVGMVLSSCNLSGNVSSVCLRACACANLHCIYRQARRLPHPKAPSRKRNKNTPITVGTPVSHRSCFVENRNPFFYVAATVLALRSSSAASEPPQWRVGTHFGESRNLLCCVGTTPVTRRNTFCGESEPSLLCRNRPYGGSEHVLWRVGT